MVDPADWVGEAVHQSGCFGMSGMRKRDGRFHANSIKAGSLPCEQHRKCFRMDFPM
jgi:hypothetical protein